jgi:5-methylcytosine-specific restriction endonuclease McrA
MSDCLVLNGDGAPISLLPLSVIPWQESIKFMVLEKCVVLHWHEDWVIHSARWSTLVPSVIMMKDYRRTKDVVRFSRHAIYLRDNGQCQYCGISLSPSESTLDHVVPVSHAGKTTWTNCVLSCQHCNESKGNKAHIRPRKMPKKPTYYELVSKRKEVGFAVRHAAWLPYVDPDRISNHAHGY